MTHRIIALVFRSCATTNLAPKMSSLVLGLLAVMLIGWSSALPMTRVQRDDTDNTIEEEEEDPEARGYFDVVAQVLEKARGQPNNETGVRVAEYNPNTDLRNPEELGSYYEGDILYPEVEGSDGRNGLLATSTKWPGGVIPVKMDVGFKVGVIGRVLSAIMLFYQNVPCIRFIPWTFQPNYIRITSGNTGCWSSVGRVGGGQQLNLQSPGCTSSMGTILHELMHATGFLHEQSRSDRDDHVIIKTENIIPDQVYNFAKAGAGTTTSYGVPYNYQSVLHYSSTSFSRNGQPTIVGKPNANAAMGQRVGFAPSDIKKLRAMYGCPA